MQLKNKSILKKVLVSLLAISIVLNAGCATVPASATNLTVATASCGELRQAHEELLKYNDELLNDSPNQNDFAITTLVSVAAFLGLPYLFLNFVHLVPPDLMIPAMVVVGFGPTLYTTLTTGAYAETIANNEVKIMEIENQIALSCARG